MIIMYRKKITTIIIKFGVQKKENALKLIKQLYVLLYPNLCVAFLSVPNILLVLIVIVK